MQTKSPQQDQPRNRHERRAVAAGHQPAAWRVKSWLAEVPIGRTKFYAECEAGRIKIVKVGSATLVVTTPEAYIASLQSV